MRFYLLVITHSFVSLHAMNSQIPPVYFIPPASYQSPYSMPHYQQPIYYPSYYAPLQYPAIVQNYAARNTHEHLTSESSPSQNSSSSFSSDIISSDDHDGNNENDVIKIIDATIETINAVQAKTARQFQPPVHITPSQPLPQIPIVTQQHANSQANTIAAQTVRLEEINNRLFRALSTHTRCMLIRNYLYEHYPHCTTCHTRQFYYYNQIIHTIKAHKQCVECPQLPVAQTYRDMVAHLRIYHSNRVKLIELLERRIEPN